MSRLIPPERMKVPKDRIPQFDPACIKCKGAVRTIMSLPMAEFYMRRHRCKDLACRETFYSMAFYNSPKRIVTKFVPKDRALTPWEISERQRWWDESNERLMAPDHSPAEFTPRGNEPAILADIALALSIAPSDRTVLQQFIADMVDAIQQEIDAGEGHLQGGGDADTDKRREAPGGNETPSDEIGSALDGLREGYEPAGVAEDQLPLLFEGGVPIGRE